MVSLLSRRRVFQLEYPVESSPRCDEGMEGLYAAMGKTSVIP